MSVLAAAALAATAALAGGGLGRLAAGDGEDPLFRLALRLVAGLVGLYLGLLLLDLLAIPWNPLAVLAVLGVTAAAGYRASRGVARTSALPWDLGWGEAVAAGALLVYAVLAVRGWIVHPDFIYHWGIKGQRFYLAGGIDYAFLAAPWRWYVHPDYPNLVPALYAASASAAHGFRVGAAMLWSALTFALTLAGARQVLRQAGASPFWRNWTLAATATALAAFGIGYLTAGGADWPVACAPLLAWPALAAPPGRAGDWQVGLAAALAAGAKVEGVVLAAFLVTLHLLRRDGSGRPRALGRGALARSALPAALVVLPWLVQGWRHGLFAQAHAGALRPERAGEILLALGRSLAIPEWYGVPLVLLLIPVLLLPRFTRPAAAVCGLQLLFYLWVYLTTPQAGPEGIGSFVASNFGRLAFHLVPTLLVAVGLAVDRLLEGKGTSVTVASPTG